jgi:hypothetical protein
MNETDRKTPVGTWPPPRYIDERGNNQETVIAAVPPELIKKLIDSGSMAIDDPEADQENSR